MRFARLTGGSDGPAQAALVAVLAAVVFSSTSPFAAPLHDVFGGLVGPPALPVVVVEADGPLDRAAAIASAAGARSVHAPLPDGHPLLAGVAPEPAGLATDRRGVVRWFRGRRLPLPEALPGLVRVSVAQLDPTNPEQLRGRDVVLAFADPSMGPTALAPRATAPVGRAELLAVGLGAEAAGATLRTVPDLVAFGLASGAALLWWTALRRMTVCAGVAVGSALAVAAAAATLGARSLAVDLPVEAVLPVLLLPLGVRAIGAAATVQGELDRVALRLGVPTDDLRQRSGVEARGAMVAMLVAGHAVGTWILGPDGRIVHSVIAGDPSWLPRLDALPGAGLAAVGWRVEPVLEEGAVVGALGVGRDAGIAADVAQVLSAIARAPLSVPELRQPSPRDPLVARLQIVSDALDRSLKRADTWRALLGESGLQLGLFELGGDLVAAAGTLRDRIDPRAPNPLLDLLGQVTDFEAPLLTTVLRRAIAGGAPRRIPSRQGDEEVVVSRVLAEGGAVIGLLVQVHDVTAHHKLDELKSNLILANAGRLRNTLGSIVGYADMALMADDVAEAGTLLERIRDRVLASVEDIDRAERLAQTRVGEAPIQPVFLAAAVREIVAALPADQRDRVDLDLPAVESPVATRAVPLARALGTLLGEIVRQGCRVRLRVWPEEAIVRLSIEDDSGGLPTPILDRWVDPDSGSPMGEAVGEIRAIGGTLRHETLPGAGVRLDLSFPQF